MNHNIFRKDYQITLHHNVLKKLISDHRESDWRNGSVRNYLQWYHFNGKLYLSAD